MKFFKFISIILHPIVIPTIGVMLYFLLIANNISREIQFTVLSLVFIITYLIPLVVLFILKHLKIISNYKAAKISERKIPLAIMIGLFYMLGKSLHSIHNLRDLGLLFYATSLALLVTYFLFYLKFKASIHLLSFGIPIGFFLVLIDKYSQPFLLVIMILFILSGLLASSRLHLKAHSSKEIYVGFFIGIFSTLSLYFIL